MKKNIIIVIVLLLLFSIAIGIIYLNNVYLPVKIKARLINTLEESLNYNVDIEELKYSLIKGIIIKNIFVYDKQKDKANTILTVKEAHFSFLYLPLFKQRKIIVPVLNIDSPYLYIRYIKDNVFNFWKVFLPRVGQTDKKKARFSFIVYKINISDGACLFEDERLAPKFSKTLQELKIGINVTPTAKISFSVQGKIFADKEKVTKILLQGKYNLLSEELNSNLGVTNLSICDFNPYLKDLPLSIISGSVETSNLDLNSKANVIGLKGLISVKDLEAKKEDLTLSGDINVESNLIYAIDKKELNYKANFKLIQAKLLGLKYVDKIDNISGDMGLDKDKLWTENLELQALDSVFTLKFTLENFLTPYLKLNLTSNQVNLEKTFSIFSLPRGLKLSGASKLDINLEGNLQKLPLDMKANLDINNAKLETAFLKDPLNNIKGNISITCGGISWNNLSFNYQDTTYASTGKLSDFKEPQANFILNSKDLNLQADIKTKDRLVKINTFNAKYINSSVDIKGDVNIEESTNPLFNLTTNSNINTQDMLSILSKPFGENIKKIKLGGDLNISGSVAGKAKDYREWAVSLKANSDMLSIYNLKLNNLSFNLEQENGILNIPNLNAFCYSGIINLGLTSNLKAGVPIYTLKFTSSGIDLSNLKLDTELKKQDISGMLNINADLYGDFKDIANLKGRGFISIHDGRLWKLDLLKGLGELFLLPDYEKIIFKEAKGDFDVQDKFISTENLQLTSEQLKLNCNGKMGFDGALDFTVYTEANENLIRDSSDIRKFTAAILGELGKAISIKISGTIKKPKYSVIPMPLDLIKNIKDFFLGK